MAHGQLFLKRSRIQIALIFASAIILDYEPDTVPGESILDRLNQESKRMVSGLLGKELPGNRLRVRIPCSPLIDLKPVVCLVNNGLFAWIP